MTAATTAAPASPAKARKRTLANSPNRRREVVRVAVWVLFAGAATVAAPYLLLHV